MHITKFVRFSHKIFAYAYLVFVSNIVPVHRLPGVFLNSGAILLYGLQVCLILLISVHFTNTVNQFAR